MRFDMGHVHGVESANEAYRALDGIRECSSNSVRSSQTFASKNKLTQCLGVGDNVNRQ